MISILAVLLIPILFALIFAGVYSWYFGVSTFKAAITGALGFSTGAFMDTITRTGDVLRAGLAHFGDPSYLGQSMLAVVLFVLILVLFINFFSTIDKSPTIIR